MKIQSFDIKTQSERTSLYYETKRSTFTEKIAPRGQLEKEPVELELSEKAKYAAKLPEGEKDSKPCITASAPALKCKKKDGKTPSVNDAKLMLLEELIYRLTGKKLKLRLPDLSMQNERTSAPSMPDGMEVTASGSGAQTGMSRYVEIETEHFMLDAEYTSYIAQGIINTADGQSLHVDIEMNLSRTFISHSKTKINIESALKDPLIINYEGDAASLSDESFAFDIDLDGTLDEIRFAGSGSGFLALDRNKDGKINDGFELFGPKTGSGFEELRAFDVDKNGWIDENDDIFQHLVIWSRDKDGNDQLFTLKDKNIGAIYLGDTETEFSFKNSENVTHGVMRATSFYVKEDGGGGLISHIDLSL